MHRAARSVRAHQSKSLFKREQRRFAGERNLGSVATVSARIRGKPAFQPAAFLAHTGLGRTIVDLKKDQTIFSQGDAADAVFYVQKGRVKLTVVSSGGKEATIALLGGGTSWERIALPAPIRCAWRPRPQ
jgi:CRP-like cAMP-binding protein